MGHLQASAADVGDAGADQYGVGEGELAAIVALDRGQDWSLPLIRHHVAETRAAEVFDPGRFHPAEMDDVVDVAKSVLITPLHGER